MEGFFDSGLVWIALLMGVAGSAHCIGMCGGFAVLAGSSATSGSKARINLTVWLLGKTLTYTVLGAILGAMSDAVPTSFSFFQSAVVLFTAGLLIVTGLHMAGIGPAWSIVAPSPVSSFVTRMAAVVRNASLAGRFTLGLLNGLLPCGLVYGALAYSLTYQSATKGAAFMALFGLGTIPVLFLIGIGTGVLHQKYRAVVTRVIGWVVVLLGLVTLTRLPALMHLMH